MDEDYILALTVFLLLVVCGISVMWAAWKHRNEDYQQLPV
jgi:cell division protein FtsL